MDLVVKFAEGFMNLFQTGADVFISWMGSIIPLVLLLLEALNALISM